MFGLKPNLYTELCGWYGMFALILAYGLTSFGIVAGDSLPFQVLNVATATPIQNDEILGDG